MNYDIHIHTTFSDGAHSVREQVRFGEAMGLDAIAITDHFTPGSKLSRNEDTFASYLDEIKGAIAEVDLKVLTGVEGTILDLEGNVSIPQRIADQVDLVLIDFGGYTQGILRDTPPGPEQLIENVTKCLLEVCENKVVDIVAHPFNLGRCEPPIAPSEIPRENLSRIAQAFAANNKIFEVMNCMFWWFPDMPVKAFTSQYIEIVKIFAERGVRFSIGSDDHRTGVGNLAWSRRVLKEVGAPAEQIIDPVELFSR